MFHTIVKKDLCVMKHEILVLIVMIILSISGCSRQKNSEIRKSQETLAQGQDEKESWWIKRNQDHAIPEVSKKIDLSKYDAYFVDPKAGKKKYIYLTFDCGYENGFTPKILDVLKKEKVPAGFFVTKAFIRENPDLVKRMKKEGHVVGNHTVHHKSMPSLSDRDIKQEINDCSEFCKEATGYEMDRFFRPPMGEYSERTLKVVKEMGYKTIFWSIAYLDYDVNNQPGEEYVINHFKQNYHNGAIPLIHNVSKSNANALSRVICTLRKKGYQFLSLKKLPDY